MAKKAETTKTIDPAKAEARNKTIEILSKARRPAEADGLDMQCLLKLITPVAQNGKPAEEPYAIVPLTMKKDWFYSVFPGGTLQTRYTIVGNLVIGEGLVYPNGNETVADPGGARRSPMCFTASASRSMNEPNAVAMATQAALSMALGNAGFQTPAYIEFDPEKSIVMRTEDTRLDELLDAERGTSLFGTPATSSDTAAKKAAAATKSETATTSEAKAPPVTASPSDKPATPVTEAATEAPAPEAPKKESKPAEKPAAAESPVADAKIPETIEEALATIVHIPGGFRGRTMKEVVGTATNANSARRRVERMTDKQYIKRQDPKFDEGGEELYQAETAAATIILGEDLEKLLASLREG